MYCRYLNLVHCWSRYQVLNQKLRFEYLQKKGEKQGINCMANQRDMSTRNRYLFEHKAVFVLFFVQKPKTDLTIAFF